MNSRRTRSSYTFDVVSLAIFPELFFGKQTLKIILYIYIYKILFHLSYFCRFTVHKNRRLCLESVLLP